MKFSFIILISILVLSCSPSMEYSDDVYKKIKFSIDQIDHDGLYGPDGGLRSLDYEFCIPADSESELEVMKIDPSLKIHKSSPGRSNCGDGKYLCIGNTQQVGWKTKLLRLASLEYVKEINESHWE